jgi:hypothetical protein
VVVGVLALALAVGGWWLAYREPSLEVIQEAVAPYSVGSVGCEPKDWTVSSFAVPLPSSWLANMMAEKAARFAAEHSPQKARIVVSFVAEGDSRAIVTEMWACDS